MKNTKFQVMQKTVKAKYNNLTLYRKIIILVLFVLCVNLLANSLSLVYISRSNNKLLYEAISSTLTTGTDIIASKLADIQKMTDMMIIDSRVQDNLTISAESSDNIEKNEAYLTLTFLIPEYYNNYKSNAITFIDLQTNNYTIHSNAILSQKVSSDIIQTGLLKSGEKSGYPIWIDTYSNDHGFFLVRDIRKAKNLEFTRLGTIIVNIDFDKLIHSSINTDMFFDPAYYIVLNNDNVVYRSQELATLNTDNVAADLQNKEFGVMRLDHDRYFYVRTPIQKFKWEIICLVPYQKVYSAQILSFAGAFAINLIGAFLVFLVARLFINSITIHFSNLVKKMQTFAKSHTFKSTDSYNYLERMDEIGTLHSTFDQMAIEHQTLVEKYYNQEILTRDAKLKALENQINPHFLYNTLESINWKARALGDKDISLMIESLGALLRTTLGHKEGNITSTIEDELTIVNYYMDIIRLRFGDRISYETTIDPNLNDVLLPQLTLQPLVENAVNYAMEETTENCEIHVSILHETDHIKIEITNTGSQFHDDLIYKLENKLIEPQGNGIGILNIQKRISMIYGSQYGLHFYNPDDDYATVQILIPYEGEPL